MIILQFKPSRYLSGLLAANALLLGAFKARLYPQKPSSTVYCTYPSSSSNKVTFFLKERESGFKLALWKQGRMFRGCMRSQCKDLTVASGMAIVTSPCLGEFESILYCAIPTCSR